MNQRQDGASVKIRMVDSDNGVELVQQLPKHTGQRQNNDDYQARATIWMSMRLIMRLWLLMIWESSYIESYGLIPPYC
ncbi:MAG: hypothetical protein ACLFVP_07045 [Candidatus Bathyarchaeia archaeon]